MKNTTSSAIQSVCGTALAATFILASANAGAVVISTTGNTAASMADAVLATNSGITIVAGSATIQGTNTPALQQYGTYSGFNLAPKSGSTPTLTMANGIVLTTGKANMPATNTSTQYSNVTGSGANAQLAALSGTTTADANVLGFNFTVDQNATSVAAKFVFGTEEFPDQLVTDIFGFFVDGVNYAKFANGSLISNAPGTNNFISNVNGAYGIEYDGLTNVLSITALLNSNLATHTLSFGVADTSDNIYDSGVFLNSLAANEKPTTGGISNDVPEPASLALFGIALGAGALARRRKSRS